MDLSLVNVVNVSVSAAQAGLGQYNTSNVGLFTHEAPLPSFGNAGYKIYLEPTEVATDFGSSSNTYKEALALFSQQPNILAGGGYLAVILLNPEVQHIAASATPASGSFKLHFGGIDTALINWNDTAAQVQAKLRAITGLENVTVTGSIAAGLDVHFVGLYGTQALLTVNTNTLQDAGAGAVNLTVTETTAGELLDAAITRTKSLVQYFGVMGARIFSQADMLAAAAVIQALNKIAFFVSNTAADVAPGGMLDLLRSGSYTQSRGLFYGDTVINALCFMAAYVGRALSTDFSGSNTTQTMHLKDLATIQPDPSMDQTLLDQCVTAGVDTYVSLQGVAKVFTSGANSFFDDVYNLQWFVGAIQVAYFNALAQVGTKLPQTEQGMDVLRGECRKICEQAVFNQYSAPGQWNSPTTFGVQGDFLRNIQERGYYIYSAPVAQQSQAQRAARQAPLVQIALKEAGAIQKGNVVIYVNQ